MCSVKTMVKMALGIAMLLIVGYAVFPEMRNMIAIAGPYLLFLACPLAMFFMMKSMNMQGKEKKPDQDEK
jgi:NhaP-type Na+/H+ and K+/H+ antiporter